MRNKDNNEWKIIDVLKDGREVFFISSEFESLSKEDKTEALSHLLGWVWAMCSKTSCLPDDALIEMSKARWLRIMPKRTTIDDGGAMLQSGEGK